MGQCYSSPVIGGETEQAYRAKWEGGGLGDGLPAYQDNKFMSSPTPAPKQNVYSTTADVGMGRNTGFLYDKFSAIPLDAIDENKSLQLAATAAAPPGSSSPQRQAAAGIGQTPVSRVSSESGPSKVPENWTKGELIGQGAFGSVYLGMDNDTGQLIAVKQVSLGQRGGPQAAAKLAEHVRSLEAEVQLLQDLKHPNIVRYLGTERTKDALNIFLEYVPGGSIASLLAKFGSFQESVVRVYTKQILQGLLYLHGQGVIHRDIKGANILVANTGLVKLADFGASKKIEGLATMESGFKSVKGTPYWMAPEVITATGHGKQADIWSVACTVIEMATGKPPWMQFGSQVAAMFHIAKSKGPPTIPEHLSPECKDFLYLCFNRNWKERPSAATLLQHAFLKNVDVVASGSLDDAGVSANTTNAIMGGDLTQIPAYRSSGGSAVVAGGAVGGRQGSPPKPGAGGNTTATTTRSGMSPLGNHLANSRGNGIGISTGSRRQLNLDAAAAGGGGDGGGGASSVSPSKRPSAVMSSAPVFANVRDSTGVGPPSAVLLDGGRLTRPMTTPRGGRGAAAAADGSARDSWQQKQEESKDDAGIPLIVPDPTTLGSLRRSGSASLSLPKEKTAAGAAAVKSAGQQHRQHPATGSSVDMNSDLMATIALSSGINIATDVNNGGSSHKSAASTSLQASLASTAQQSTSTVSGCTTGTVEQENTSTTTSVDQTTTMRPHSGTGSGVSQNSKKSEFNPMEEPAWMAAAAAAGARNSLNGNSSGSDMMMHINGSPSDGEATSIYPLPSSSAMMPPPPPSATCQQQQLGRSTSSSGRDSGRFLQTSSSSSQGGSGIVSAATSSGTANTNTTSAVHPSGTAASASEGPVVYTVEADLDGAGPGGLPWDMPDSDIATATTTRSGVTLSSSQLPPGRSASLSRWGRPAEEIQPSSRTSSQQRPQISSAAASAATPATTSSTGDGAVDQDVILNALQQCAQRDLRASMALFAEANRHRSSSGGSSSLNSKSSSDASGNGGGGNGIAVANFTKSHLKNRPPAATTTTARVEEDDPTEVTSPARHRVSVHKSRIPRAPSESPIAKQQQQRQSSLGLNTNQTVATPRRSRQGAYPTAGTATPTKIASLGANQVASMMTPSRSAALMTPSRAPRRTSAAAAGGAVVPPSPRGAATPSKQLRAATYTSPTKRQYSASVSGGSYEQQLRARQAGTTGVGTSSIGGGGSSYAARAAAVAAGTPAKSANTHPLRTPRREGGGSRPGSAAMTPQRRASALP